MCIVISIKYIVTKNNYSYYYYKNDHNYYLIIFYSLICYCTVIYSIKTSSSPPYSILMLNQYLRNVELQHCEYCSNIAKCRFNIEETLQKCLMSNYNFLCLWDIKNFSHINLVLLLK